MSSENEETLEWCTARVSCDGRVTATYRWSGNDIDGQDQYDDEDVAEWTDSDIRDLVSGLVGIEGDDVKKIQIERE